MKPLVSIITPCYNGNGKIQLYLDSILNQTYDNLEIILINDGSTDNTENIILSYKDKFIEKGYKFIYLKQKNSGQDVALNNGLKFFSGEYLTWPDADDILLEQNIEKKVKFLEEHKECGLVYCNAEIVDSRNINKVIEKWDRENSNIKEINFKDILVGKNILFAPGAWMARSEYFLDVRPNREIEISGQGQNWQMLLPLAYKYAVGKVDDCLFKYIVYKDSHSHQNRNYKEAMEYIEKKYKGLNLILNNIKMPNRKFNLYMDIVNRFIYLEKLNCSILYNNKKDFKNIYPILKNELNLKLKIKCILFKYNLLSMIKFLIKK